MPPAPLEARFLQQLAALDLDPTRSTVVVALSGGRDSVTLLHLLRFVARVPPRSLIAAHLDHAMRPDSKADRQWVTGLCAAWGVRCVWERVEAPPAGETAAREARRRFLRRAAAAAGATHLVTAHHADDQAETVLFRALRGTGLHGLAGIRARGRGGLVRPLLPFWSEELGAYAASRGLRWREDPTNRTGIAARNRIRLELLPRLEREVAPGARRNLVALAELAAEAEAALEVAAERALERDLLRDGDPSALARAGWRGYDSAIASRSLRILLRRSGVVLTRAGTRAALQFISDSPSGRELQLPGGLRLRAELDLVTIGTTAGAEAPPTADQEVELSRSPAEGRVVLGGRRYGVRLQQGPAGPPDRWGAALPYGTTRLPLRVRGWRPGDRIATRGGTKSLKKLFLEERVPRPARGQLPVIVDALGVPLWVAGLDRPPTHLAADGEDALLLSFVND